MAKKRTVKKASRRKTKVTRRVSSRASSYTKSYSKRPMWQWVVIYALVGGVVYALIYQFMGYGTSQSPSSEVPTPTQVMEAAPTPQY